MGEVHTSRCGLQLGTSFLVCLSSNCHKLLVCLSSHWLISSGHWQTFVGPTAKSGGAQVPWACSNLQVSGTYMDKGQVGHLEGEQWAGSSTAVGQISHKTQQPQTSSVYIILLSPRG